MYLLKSKHLPTLKPLFSRHKFSSLIPQNPSPSPSSLAHLVNQVSRVLSDHRNPRHDLELSLSPFSSLLTTDLVEQVLKRCKNLGFPAHRFFLWAKRLPGFTHSDDTHRILVDVLGSSKQFALLWDFLVESRESSSFAIDPEVFWVVFRGYSKAGLPEDAIRAFGRMGEFGLRPSIDDLDKLLFVLCKGKHVKEAQLFFDRVKHRYEARAKSYSILVRGWGDVGDFENARKVFDQMLDRRCFMDVLAYNSLLEAMCRGGRVGEAYKMFEEMGSHGVQLDACSYSIFIRAYCESNDFHSVFRMLDRMRRYNLVTNTFTYNGVIKKLCKNEKVDEAYQLLNEMFENGVTPDAWSYNTLLAYHCEHSEVNRASKLVSRMVKGGCSPDRHTYNMLLKLLIRVGRFDRATQLWETIGDNGFYPTVSTFSVMIHGLCKKRGKLEEACKYFETMIDEGIPPYSTTIEMLRNKLIGLGMLDQIEILAGKMERSTSCSIQEQAKALRGNRSARVRSEIDESDYESDWYRY